jgi:capsular polysaccharide transport system permease protein
MTATISPPGGPTLPPLLPMRKPVAPRHYRRPFASMRTITALILREMATTYGRSPGGYVWAVLEPVAGIVLLSLVFSFALNTPAIGRNFQLFYATGVIPLGIFATVSGRLAQSLNFSRPLLAYPSVTFIDAILARFILSMLTQIMVSYIVFTGILVYYDVKVILKIGSIAEALALAGFLALGIGTLNCYLFTRFPIWQQAWAILMRPMFIISCVFMIYDHLPEQMRYFLWFNPVVHIVGLMRYGFYSSYHASYVSVSYVLAVGGFSLALGLLLLRRHQYTLLLR